MELAFFFGRAGRRGERAEDCAGAGVVWVVSSVAHQRATGEVGLVAPAYMSVAFSCTTSSVRQALYTPFGWFRLALEPTFSALVAPRRVIWMPQLTCKRIALRCEVASIHDVCRGVCAGGGQPGVPLTCGGCPGAALLLSGPWSLPFVTRCRRAASRPGSLPSCLFVGRRQRLSPWRLGSRRSLTTPRGPGRVRLLCGWRRRCPRELRAGTAALLWMVWAGLSAV